MTTKIVKSDSINSYHQWDTEVIEIATDTYIPQVGIYGTVPVSGQVSLIENVSEIGTSESESLSGVSSINRALPAGCSRVGLQLLLSSSPTLYAWIVINTTASQVPAPATGGFVFSHRGEAVLDGLNSNFQYYVHVGLYSSAEVLSSGGANDRLVIQPWVVV